MGKFIAAVHPEHAVLMLGNDEVDHRIVAGSIHFFPGRRRNFSSAMKCKNPVVAGQNLFRQDCEKVEVLIDLNGDQIVWQDSLQGSNLLRGSGETMQAGTRLGAIVGLTIVCHRIFSARLGGNSDLSARHRRRRRSLLWSRPGRRA